MKTDDRAWFDPLVRDLGNRAIRFAVMLVGNIDTAQEIVQEAFMRCWASPKTPSSDADFRRWLYRIIVNLARDHHRQRARLSRVPIPPQPSPDPMEQVDRRSEDQEVLLALRTLSERERLAIYLRYFEDQSFAETARIMDSPQVTIRVLVHRALVKLRRTMKEVAV